MGILDLFFPKKCLGCGRIESYICSDCVNKLPVLNFQKCPMCEERSVTGKTHKRCEKALGMDGLTGGFRYRGVMRKMIGKYKYQYVSDLLSDLTEVMISFSDLEILSYKKFDVVTCVPLHSSRERERGYNQAELVAEKIAEYLGVSFEKDLLTRKKKTRVQSGLERNERVKNIRGAFQVRSSSFDDGFTIKNRKVLIVDDVWTTGSTMRECGKVLKRNGVKMVWGLVLAM